MDVKKRKRASWTLGNAIRRGEIPPASECTCSSCGTNRIKDPKVTMDYHHEDYDKPLDVIPLCRKCHHIREREINPDTGRYKNKTEVSLETRRKQSEAAKRAVYSEEERKARSIRASSRKWSEEVKQQMSQSHQYRIAGKEPIMHNIFNSRFYSLRQPAWHSIGTIGTEEQTATEVFNTMTPYIVTLEPVFTKIGNVKLELPNQVITRHPIPDDNVYRSFGVVGPEYTLVDPLRTCEIWDEATQKPVETLGVLGEGESLFITTKLPSFQISANGITDDVDSYLLLHSPYGNGAIQVRVTPVRVVCQNTLIAAKAASTETFRIIHDSNVEKRLAGWMNGIVERAENKSNFLNEAFNLMASTNVDDEVAEDLLKRIYVDPNKPSYVPDKSVMERREKAYEATVRWNVDWRSRVMEDWKGEGMGMDSPIMQSTLWGLYNAVVEIEDYRPTSQDDSRAYNSLFGDRSLRKEVAYAELFQFSVENQS